MLGKEKKAPTRKEKKENPGILLHKKREVRENYSLRGGGKPNLRRGKNRISERDSAAYYLLRQPSGNHFR